MYISMTYSDVTWESWCIKSPVVDCLFNRFMQADIKENIKVLCYWHFVQGSRWCPVHSDYGDVIMTTIASQITSLTIVYPTFYSGADQSKHQSSASLAFVWGIHRGPVNSPHKRPVTRKIFPVDDVIMHGEKASNAERVSMSHYRNAVVGSPADWTGISNNIIWGKPWQPWQGNAFRIIWPLCVKGIHGSQINKVLP